MGFRKMLRGFRDFQHEHFKTDRKLYNKLVNKGQSPKVMVIACSDSRIDPAIITKSAPGEIFTVRNIAAMVPPTESAEDRTHHGTAAAVEYAVKYLKVEHIVMIGHALCGGIDALARSDLPEDEQSYIGRWISIGLDARDEVRSVFADKAPEEHSKILEKTSLLVSVNNLMTYPWVREAVEAGRLKLHAWYFDIRQGTLLNYNPGTNEFEDVLDKSVSAAMCHASIDRDAAISITDYLQHLRNCECQPAKKQSTEIGLKKPGVVRKAKARLKKATQSALAITGTSPLAADATELLSVVTDVL